MRRRSSPRTNSKPIPAITPDNTVVVNKRGATRIREGHPWVYRSDLVSTNGVASASLVPVCDEQGRPLGTALYSSASQIAVRVLSRALLDPEQLPGIVRERVREAAHYRERTVRDSSAFRVVFSEADFLPGLIVDKYNDVLTLQILTQALDHIDVRTAIVAELVAQYAPAGIVERVESRIRELEELPPRETSLLQGHKTATEFSLNGLRFAFDAMAGQKTGAFLDQRENYAAAERHAHGKALDVFCYQGGFALHMARACESVTGVDASREALETADSNASLNGMDLEWIEANAFELLRDYAEVGHQYDTIVLDPPAFAKTKAALEGAIRGYKELNLRALKMLRPGGTLVTCSCSYHVSEADFVAMLASASVDARRDLRIIERRVQALDHPVLATVPETNYLKCVIARVR